MESGTRLSHYEISTLLGKGGMGEVWRAKDTKLGREVAIKTLPEEFARDLDRLARFKREARLLASLNHPNIAAIHGFEEDNGTHFLVLELVEGETLADQLKLGAIPVEESLKLALQIAEALEAAHEKGVIHRDLKPANIKVTPDGKVKVLDFGLAKAVAGETPRTDLSTLTVLETKEGIIQGTPAYMSPQQARGEVVDKRTDIWAFGCVLYEMLTGRRPFRGETLTDMMARILEREPDWEALPRSTPGQVRELLERCLQKDTNQRLGEIREAGSLIEEALVGPRRQRVTRRQALAMGGVALVPLMAVTLGLNVGGVRDRLFGTGAPVSIQSIAVLPLQNLSGDPEQEYFAEGMHDALITDLAKISGLRKVIARASVMRYRNTDKLLPQIGRELRVDALITGTVLREGDQVRITAQLINAATEEQLWAARYERQLRDVLSLQNDVVTAIIREMRLQLTPQEQTRLASARPVDPEVYEAYLRGKFYLNQLTPEGIERGLEYLHQAVENDPADALAYSGLALGYSLISSHTPSPPPDAVLRAKAAAIRALELDETLAEAHSALAQIRFYNEWDWEGAEAAFRRALELNPNLPEAHAHYGWYLNLFGRQEEALAEMRRAQQVDPLTPTYTAWRGDLNYFFGEYDETIEFESEALELDPDFAWANHFLGRAYAQKGMYEEAIAANERAIAVDPAWMWGLAVRG